MKGKDNKCPRCEKWHQKLFPYYDNLEQKGSAMCLSCISELVVSRTPNWVLESLSYQILGILQNKLKK